MSAKNVPVITAHAGLLLVRPVREGDGAVRLASPSRCELQEQWLQNRSRPHRPHEQGYWGLGCYRLSVTALGVICNHLPYERLNRMRGCFEAGDAGARLLVAPCEVERFVLLASVEHDDDAASVGVYGATGL